LNCKISYGHPINSAGITSNNTLTEYQGVIITISSGRHDWLYNPLIAVKRQTLGRLLS